MTTSELGPVGVSLDIDPAGAHLDAAAEIEQLGYSTLWIPGGQLDRWTGSPSWSGPPGASRWRRGSSRSTSTRRTRWPGGTPELAAEAPGRVVVGLGGPQQQPRPLRALGHYLDQLDAADPPVPAQRRILAALGPRKLALARDRAAGAVPLLVNPGYTAQARAVLGADRALVISQMVVLDADPVRARELARGPLGFLAAGEAATARSGPGWVSPSPRSTRWPTGWSTSWSPGGSRR